MGKVFLLVFFVVVYNLYIYMVRQDGIIWVAIRLLRGDCECHPFMLLCEVFISSYLGRKNIRIYVAQFFLVAMERN